MTKQRRLNLIARGKYQKALDKRKEHNRNYYLRHRADSYYREASGGAVSLKRDSIGNIIYDRPRTQKNKDAE